MHSAEHIQSLKRKLTTTDFESAWARGKVLDFDDVVTELMER